MTTATATVRKANIRETTLEVLFKEFAIPGFYWEEFKLLVYYGNRPAADLLFRLNHVGNYMQCLQAICPSCPSSPSTSSRPRVGNPPRVARRANREAQRRMTPS